MSYQHETQERNPSTAQPNSVYPLMSTSGRDVDHVKGYLFSRHLSYGLAEEYGWYPSRHANDDFLRLVIPCCTRVLGHVYWQARAVSPYAKIRYQSPVGPRLDAIVHLPVFGEVYPKRRIRVITEGPMDALAAAMLGYESFALMGITPPDSTLDFIVEKIRETKNAYPKFPTIVLLDNESEASSAAMQITMRLASKGIKARPSATYNHKDLASMHPSARQSFLRMEETSLA